MILGCLSCCTRQYGWAEKQSVWSSCVTLGRTISSGPSWSEWSIAFSSQCLILTTTEKNKQIAFCKLVYSPFPQPMRLHSIMFGLKQATSPVLHLLIPGRVGAFKGNHTPASLRCEGIGSAMLLRAVASARLLPNSVVKSAAVHGNTFISNFFVRLPLMVGNQRIKLF